MADQNAINTASLVNGDTFVGSNQLGQFNEMTLTFTAGGQIGSPNFWFLPGSGSTANKALPSGITYSGDFDTFADLIDYVNTNPLWLRYIRMQTSNTVNYSGKIQLSERKPNNIGNNVQPIPLAKFRESVGTGYSDVLTITENDLAGGKLLRGAFNAEMLGMQINSTLTIYLGISHWVNKMQVYAIN